MNKTKQRLINELIIYGRTSFQENHQPTSHQFISAPISPEIIRQVNQEQRFFLKFDATTTNREHQSLSAHPPPVPSSYLPQAHWPKIAISKFNGDCRSWPAFAQLIKSALEETKLLDLCKVAFRESLT